MIKEKAILTHSERKVIKTFINDGVRPDHYDGKNGLFRLGAELNCVRGIDLDKNGLISDTDIEDIKLLLSAVDIPPSTFFIDDHCIYVDWTANGFLAIKSRKDYLKLALEFASYIDSLELFEFKVNTGMFDDDPVEYDEYTEKLRQIQLPEFTAENYGASYEEMIVHDCRP